MDPPASGLCQTVLAPQHNKVFPHIPETTSDPVLSPLPRKVTQQIIPDNIYDGGHVRSWVTEQEHESTVWETVALTTCLFLFFALPHKYSLHLDIWLPNLGNSKNL